MFNPHERITSSSEKIYQSVFEFFTYKSGSAISVSDTNWILCVDRCLFRFCISEDVGGAICVDANSILISHTCFDTCFISSAIFDVFGNAIYGTTKNPNSPTSQINASSFLCCGPKISISADSTIYINWFSSIYHQLNFSRCCSSDGSAAISIASTSGKASYIEVFEGVSTHISCAFGYVTLGISFSNFLKWTPNSENAIFWSDNGKTTLEDCCVFIFNPTYTLGRVEFLQRCYGNINGISKTETTQILLPKIRADDYCDHLNKRLSDKKTRPKICILLHLSIIFVCL